MAGKVGRKEGRDRCTGGCVMEKRSGVEAREGEEGHYVGDGRGGFRHWV